MFSSLMLIDNNILALDIHIKPNLWLSNDSINNNPTYVYSMLLLLSDWRVMMSYLPSTLAAATIKEIELFNATEYIDQT
jgi:hypothetical protein